MKRTIILTSLLLAISQSLISQNSLDTIFKDFNNDQIVDTLINEWSSGSAFGGRDLTMINGKTNEKFKLSNFGSYSSFKRVVAVSDELNLDKNKPFLEVMKAILLPEKRQLIDSSLEWMLSAQFHNERLKEHTFFDLIAQPKTQWESQILKFPKPYYIHVSGDTLQHMISELDSEALKKSSNALLVYYAGAHYIHLKLDSLAPVARNSSYDIYKTPHAVFVKKAEQYRWVFFSDVDVTGAPDKLRWPSIHRIVLIDKYLIIHQEIPPDHTYYIHIVNIETQRVGRIKYESADNDGSDKRDFDGFKIDNGQLQFHPYGIKVLTKLKTKELFKALDAH